MSTTDTDRQAIRTQLQIVGLEVDQPDGEPLLHLMTRAQAEQTKNGVELAGGIARIREINATPDTDTLLPTLFGEWPPRGFRPNEVASIYCAPNERWVVSLIAGYGGPDEIDEIQNADQAAEAAVQWFTENDGVRVFVYDRLTGSMHGAQPFANEAPRAPSEVSLCDVSSAVLESLVADGAKAIAAAQAQIRLALVEQITRKVHAVDPNAAAILYRGEPALETSVEGAVTQHLVDVVDRAGVTLDRREGATTIAELVFDRTLTALLGRLAEIDGVPDISETVRLDLAAPASARE